ncbi:MAG: RDD family protein [Gammaproteobacteria bacterium]
MTTTTQSSWLLKLAQALLLSFAAAAWAQPTPPPIEGEEPSANEIQPEQDAREAPEPPAPPQPPTPERYDVYRSEVINIGSDAHLGSDEYAEVVMAIFGDVTSAGRAQDSVITIFGNAHVTGPVGNAVVTVFGDVYLDSEIGGDVVAVFGNVELDQHADIGGDIVAVGGTLKRHPDALVRGAIQEMSFAGEFGQLRWLRAWVQHCLLLGRLLAIEPGLTWAWWIAFGFLASYVLIAVLFSKAVETGVRTLESHPGQTTLASIIAVFLSPIFLVLLSITVIGIAFVPFFFLALFAAGLFGKAVVLAVLGRRIMRAATSGPLASLPLAVLVGGLLVTAIYLVPVIGFIAFSLLGMLSLGVVVYTLLLVSRARSPRAAGENATPIATSGRPCTTSETGAPGAQATASADRVDTTPPPTEEPMPPVPLTAHPRADFWVRMGALAIDAVLVGFVVNFIPGIDDPWLLALAIYGALMWKLKGTTVGGIICNLRVVRVDGRDIDWATAIVRALGCILSLVVIGLGFIWIAIDPERQAWHDKIAGTVVVRVPKGVSLV